MAGYKHPCAYCGKLVPPDANICPYCGKGTPTGPLKCPRCRDTVEKDFKLCAHCGLPLHINCPTCGKETFFGQQCDVCGASLLVTCPKCKTQQPPVGPNCVKCGKPLK
jgi:hypothetical protein